MTLSTSDLKTIMPAAFRNHILVPAFNVAYLPMVQPILDTLKKLDCFALLEVARPDVEKIGAKSFKAVAEEYQSRRPDRRFSRLHLDHVPVIDEDHHEVDWKKLIQEGLDLGFDSVMIDGSRLSLEENIQVTRTVAQMAHAKGIPTEAELGAVLGHEDGPMPPYDEIFNSGVGFTKVEEAVRFAKETGVDWLSVAIGNIHGALGAVTKHQKKIEARLNIEHLDTLAKATGIPLVLHGGSGVKQESVLAAIQHGITKINIGTEIRQVYEKGMAESNNNTKAAQEKLAGRMAEMIVDYFKIQGTATKLERFLKS